MIFWMPLTDECIVDLKFHNYIQRIIGDITATVDASGIPPCEDCATIARGLPPRVIDLNQKSNRRHLPGDRLSLTPASGRTAKDRCPHTGDLRMRRRAGAFFMLDKMMGDAH